MIIHIQMLGSGLIKLQTQYTLSQVPLLEVYGNLDILMKLEARIVPVI